MAVEDDRHRDQFQRRRGNVEQQEIEHGVDALGAAFDHLGNLASAAGEVEAQGQAVEARKHILGQRPRGILPNPLKHNVAQIIESYPGKAAQGIGKDKGQRQSEGRRTLDGHRVYRALVGIGQRQRGRLADQNQHSGANNAYPQPRIITRPQIRQKALKRAPAIVAGVGGVGVRVWRHGPYVRRRRENERVGWGFGGFMGGGRRFWGHAPRPVNLWRRWGGFCLGLVCHFRAAGPSAGSG